MQEAQVMQQLEATSAENTQRHASVDNNLAETRAKIDALERRANQAMAEFENLHRMVAYEHDQLAQLQG